MSTPNAPNAPTPAAASTPTYADLAADPAIAPLLTFTPVPRQMNKAGGWGAEMQRRFIAWLAWYGSPTRAADELGKARSGIDKVYKSPGADEFRASWDAAVALAEQRRIDATTAGSSGNGSLRAPALSRGAPARPSAEPDDQADESEQEEHKLELLAGIANKFLRKVAAERAARLSGQIAAADFYLRQITVLEVLFDLGVTSAGWNPMEFLHGLRRDRVEARRIVSTAFTDHLDAQRRRWWAEEGAPQRPPHPDPRFVEYRKSVAGDFAVEVEDNAYGAMTHPARGYTQEEWACLTVSQQEAARRAQQAEDAEAQKEWEAHAIAEHKAQSRSGT